MNTKTLTILAALALAGLAVWFWLKAKAGSTTSAATTDAATKEPKTRKIDTSNFGTWGDSETIDYPNDTMNLGTTYTLPSGYDNRLRNYVHPTNSPGNGGNNIDPV